MSDEPKWMVLYRSSKNAPWQIHRHHGDARTPYRYETIEKAIPVHRAKARIVGRDNAYIEREDRVPRVTL